MIPEPALLLRWTFVLFVLSIPFETFDFGLEGSFSISRVIGSVFFLVALLQPSVSFRRIPSAFWYFGFYVALVIIEVPFQIEEFRYHLWRERVPTLVQMLALFLVASNVLRFDRMVRLTLGALAFSCFVLAGLSFVGVTGREIKDVTRVTMLSEDANTAAAVLSLGLLAAVGLVYGRKRRVRVPAWIVAIMAISLAIAIVRTGSRGGLLALAGGFAVYLVPKASAKVRLRNIALVVLSFGALLAITLHSQDFEARWAATLERGSMSGRERLFPTAIKIFLNRPLLGWGPMTHYHVLARRLGEAPTGTHNLYLWVLDEVGLLGAVPYFTALFLCARCAWRARDGSQGILPLALLVTVLMVNMSVEWQIRKLHWLALALAVASADQVVPTRPRALRRAPPAPVTR